MPLINPYELLEEDPQKVLDGAVMYKESYLFNGLFQFFAFGGLAVAIALGNYGSIDDGVLITVSAVPLFLALSGLYASSRSISYTFDKRGGKLLIQGYRSYPLLPFKEVYGYDQVVFTIRRRFILASPPRRWYCVYLVTPSHRVVFCRESTKDEASRSLARLKRTTGVHGR